MTLRSSFAYPSSHTRLCQLADFPSLVLKGTYIQSKKKVGIKDFSSSFICFLKIIYYFCTLKSKANIPLQSRNLCA